MMSSARKRWSWFPIREWGSSLFSYWFLYEHKCQSTFFLMTFSVTVEVLIQVTFSFPRSLYLLISHPVCAPQASVAIWGGRMRDTASRRSSRPLKGDRRVNRWLKCKELSAVCAFSSLLPLDQPTHVVKVTSNLPKATSSTLFCPGPLGALAIVSHSYALKPLWLLFP